LTVEKKRRNVMNKKITLFIILLFIISGTKRIDWNKFNKTVDAVIEKIYKHPKDKRMEKRIKKYLYKMDELIMEAKK